MIFSEFDPVYQPSSGFANSPADDNLDDGMQWPPKVDQEPIDESFMQGVLPEALTISERNTVSTEHYWHELLRQFPYLIALGLSECMQAEGNLRQARDFQAQSEESDAESEAKSKAFTSLIYAKDAAQNLLKGRAYLSLALRQFDPKINPAAYYDAKDGIIIKATALQCDFSTEGINAFNSDVQSRIYFKKCYSCVSELLNNDKGVRAIAYKGLVALNSWIDKNLAIAQNIIREYQHLEDRSWLTGKLANEA